MAQSDHHNSSGYTGRKDPVDPFSLAFSLFGPTVGLASFVRGLLQQRAERLRNQETQRKHIRRHLLEVDIGLNRLGEWYRRLSSIYHEQQVLDIDTIGDALIIGDSELAEEIDNIKSIIFETGRDLQGATDELYELVGKETEQLAYKYAHGLANAFTEARLAKTLRNFMAWIGVMIIDLSNFLSELGQLYGFQATYGLSEGITATVEWMMHNSPKKQAEQAEEAARREREVQEAEAWLKEQTTVESTRGEEAAETQQDDVIGAHRDEDEKDDQQQTRHLEQ